MRKALVMFGAIAFLLALPSGAMAQVSLDLSPTPGPYNGEVIEVTAPDVEELWIHIDDGTTTGLYHVATDPEIDFDIQPSGPVPPSYGEVLSLDILPSSELTACTWYKVGTISIDGPPCTYFHITVTITVQQPYGPITSNEIVKHIIPEPCTMLTLGIGAGALLLRRRRS